MKGCHTSHATTAAFRTFVSLLLDNKNQFMAIAGRMSFWMQSLLSTKLVNSISIYCILLQVELELPRDYTSHYLCKQVPWLVAVLCRKPHGYMNDFNFDAISGQIRSLLEEDSLKDVNISFGWVVPDSKYLSIIGTWLSINITAVWNDEKGIHSTFMLKITSGMSWARNWS